jgi:excisionase family DNA binding protein
MSVVAPKSAVAAKESYDGYCGTSYAAKLLGMSVGTVQGLVEKNELKAWKTQGGHRRISLQSIHDYQRQHHIASGALSRTDAHLRLMVVEDDEPTRLMLQSNFDLWESALDVVMYDSAVEALLDMASTHPDVLMTDLRMAHVDGFQFLRKLAQHNLFQRMVVIVITGMSSQEIEAAGGLPSGVHVMHKPVDLEWLKGFIDALMSMRKLDKRPLVAA